MKNIILLFCCLFSVSILSAQNWLTDFEEAKTQAAEKNKKIVMVFMGSDWCPPCKKLNKKVLSSDAFITEASKKYVMLKVDFPKKPENKPSAIQSKNNETLLVKYNPRGAFPKIVVFDNEANVLGNLNYKRWSPKEFIVAIDGLKI